MASEKLADSWLKQEVRSESTLPLLNFLSRTKEDPTAETLVACLHEVTAGVGKDDPPIPDESEQLRSEYLRLMKEGPGKVIGNPTVRSVVGATCDLD